MKTYEIYDIENDKIIETLEWEENDLQSLQAEINLGIATADMLGHPSSVKRFEIREVK